MAALVVVDELESEELEEPESEELEPEELDELLELEPPRLSFL